MTNQPLPKELTAIEIQELIKLDLAFEYKGEIYSTYEAEMTWMGDSERIRCDQCHDSFKTPFMVYFNLLKPEIMIRCPNGCETIKQTREVGDVGN